MSVKLLAKPAVTACPQCRTQVRLPARSPSPSPVRMPAPQPSAAPAVSSLPPTPVAPDPFDLRQLDLPPSATPSGGSFASHSPRTTSGANSATKLLAWIGNHQLVTAIILLNVVALASSILYPPLLLVCAVQLPVGLVIVGAMFLPRLHLVESVSKAVGGQMAGLGAGGVLLLILAVGAKAGLRIARRSSRNENLDFSGFDPSSLGAMAGALAVAVGVIALVIYLWKLIGIVRVIAAGYLLEMSTLLLLLMIGGAVNSRRDAEMARRHEDTMAKMQRPDWATAGFENPGFNHPGSRRMRQGNAGQPNASEIRVIVMHGPNPDLGKVRETFLAKAGNPDHESQAKGPMMTEWVIQDTRSPGELAELVDFGRVLSVSEFGRTIRVGMPRKRP